MDPLSHSATRARLCARLVVFAVAVSVVGAGLRWGTWSAGSADAHGYVSQAALWLTGDLVVREPMAVSFPWDNAAWTLAPLGFRPGIAPGTLVPIYPAGLPLVMALFLWLGGSAAVYLVVPLFGGLAIAACAIVARRLAGAPSSGPIAALLLATSPTFLFSLMWPMSDVPACSLWITAIALTTSSGVASAIGAGAVAALAVLTRPNLVPVAIAPALFLAWRVFSSPAGRRQAWIRLTSYCAATATGCLAVAAIHTWLYGAPLRTGYGHVSQIYDWSRLPATAQGFGLRPLSVEPGLMVLAVIGAVVALRTTRTGSDSSAASVPRPMVPTGATSWLLLGLVAGVLIAYAFYVSFPEWWYLRLLLPAFPAAAVFAATAVTWLAQRAPRRWQAPVAALLVAGVAALGVYQARQRGVFALRQSEQRYETVARFASRALPDNAVFFAFQESGSLRYYAGRTVLRFDILEPRWFNEAISKLRTRGYRPYFVIESSETDLFKARMRVFSPLGQLDWPPMAEWQGPITVRIYDPADRDRWRLGQHVVTRRITP